MVWRSLLAGTAYFAIVFLCGFALGVPRTLLLAPRLGEGLAVVVELPIMLAVSWFACGWLVRHLRVSSLAMQRVVMGASAFGLLVTAELGLAALILDRGLAEYLSGSRQFPQMLGLAAHVAFGLMPVLHRPQKNKVR